jgi:hypothetical protein
MSTSSMLKIVLLVGAIVAIIALALKMFVRSSHDELETRTVDPDPDQGIAVAHVEDV